MRSSAHADQCVARQATQAQLAASDRRLRARQLLPTQVRALHDLTLAIEGLERFNKAAVKLALERYGPTPGGQPRHVLRDLRQEPERLKEFRKLVSDLNSAVLTAARRGLAPDPRVEDRLRTLRAVGDRETLRRARLGLERGVRRPHSMDDLDLFQEVKNLVASGKYSNWEQIRRVLTSRKIIAPMSRPAFFKLRRGLGFTGRLPKP